MSRYIKKRKNNTFAEKRYYLHKIIRKKIHGTSKRPRICIFLSHTQIVSQIIDDEKQHTLIGARIKGKNTEAVVNLAKLMAKKALDKKITNLVFDRSGYKYGGRIKSFCEELRKQGITI